MIRVFNDTSVPMTVRINIHGCQPTAKELEPKKEIAVFTKTDEVLVKLWDYNTILIQDRGEFSLDNLRVVDEKIGGNKE